MKFSPKARQVAEAVERECARLGLPRPRYEPGGKHHKAWITIHGREWYLKMSCSPSDGNAERLKIRDLHRLLRLAGAQPLDRRAP